MTTDPIDLEWLRKINLRFLSENSIPVERAHLTADEWADIYVTLTSRRARDAEVEAAVSALRHARDELASFPHSLGYAITALPKIDAALLPFQRNGDKTS
jgi:hypothetical protein